MYLFQCFSVLQPLLFKTFFLFSLTGLLSVGQLVSVASCFLAAHFQSTWLYILCTFSLVSSLLYPSRVNKPRSPPVLVCHAPHCPTSALPLGSFQRVHISLKLTWPELDQALQMCFTKAEQTGMSAPSICQLYFRQHSSGYGLLPLLPADSHSACYSLGYTSLCLQSSFTASHPPVCTSS